MKALALQLAKPVVERHAYASAQMGAADTGVAADTPATRSTETADSSEPELDDRLLDTPSMQQVLLRTYVPGVEPAESTVHEWWY